MQSFLDIECKLKEGLSGQDTDEHPDEHSAIFRKTSFVYAYNPPIVILAKHMETAH